VQINYHLNIRKIKKSKNQSPKKVNYFKYNITAMSSRDKNDRKGKIADYIRINMLKS
jgi:hypothetical protein